MAAEDRWDAEVEMNTPTKHPLGNAVFGTVRGLSEQGNGILTKAPFAIYEFEDGRQRDGVLHSLNAPDFAIFFRRIQDRTQNAEVNLIGVVSPCRDAENRRGFFGTCIALPLDNLSKTGGQFSDWGYFDPMINQQIEEVRSLRDPSTGQLIWRSLIQPMHVDQRMNWSKASGNTLILHADNDAQGLHILRTLQALAYQYESRETTILILSEPRTGSHALSSPDVEKARQTFQQDKEAALTATQAPEPSPKEATPFLKFDAPAGGVHQPSIPSSQTSTPGVETLDDAFEWISLLQTEVDELKQEVRSLRLAPSPTRQQSTVHFTQLDQMQKFGSFQFEAEGEGRYTLAWFLFGGGIVIVIVVALWLWSLVGSSDPMDEAPVTSGAVETPASE